MSPMCQFDMTLPGVIRGVFGVTVRLVRAMGSLRSFFEASDGAAPRLNQPAAIKIRHIIVPPQLHGVIASEREAISGCRALSDRDCFGAPRVSRNDTVGFDLPAILRGDRRAAVGPPRSVSSSS
jgi:hypothetical protein